ncbi:hypothetical protein F9C28_10305 [Shimwellia pseudoproteus]|uniref:hypothetical protein n=1 Tax=Shimwellia pseudoproteus TaxID=570012 RepID=UPI0018ED32E5|nr:hypothetical protein [Shimwellia pseudoproteus]MBJ3815307.1 hypothetical protein [Shimwellia pseudoproteus]
MKKTLIALIILNTCNASTAFAAADVGTWYGGAKFGWSHYFDASSHSAGKAPNYDFDRDNVSGGVFTGALLNKSDFG